MYFLYSQPSFFPFWLGIALAALGVALAVVNNIRKEGESLPTLWKGARWGRVILFVILILAYPIVLDTLGYLIATFLLMGTLLCVGESKKIWLKIILALVIVFVSYGIFHLWLKVPLPTGPLPYP